MTVPANAPSFSSSDVNKSMGTGVLSASGYSDVLCIAEYDSVFMTMVWADGDAVDGSATLEVSDDGVNNWEAWSATLYTLAANSGSHHWDLENVAAIPYIRIALAPGSNTTGTFSAHARVEVPA